METDIGRRTLGDGHQETDNRETDIERRTSKRQTSGDGHLETDGYRETDMTDIKRRTMWKRTSGNRHQKDGNQTDVHPRYGHQKTDIKKRTSGDGHPKDGHQTNGLCGNGH